MGLPGSSMEPTEDMEEQEDPRRRFSSVARRLKSQSNTVSDHSENRKPTTPYPLDISRHRVKVTLAHGQFAHSLKHLEPVNVLQRTLVAMRSRARSVLVTLLRRSVWLQVLI